jgi:hypothetical protein
LFQVGRSSTTSRNNSLPRCRSFADGALAALILGTLTPLAAAADYTGGTAYSWTYPVFGFLMLLTAVETLRLPSDAAAVVTRGA